MCGAAARRNGYYNLGVTHIIHGYWEEGRALIQVAQPSTRTFVIDGTRVASLAEEKMGL